MRWAKKKLTRLQAWQLGADTPAESKMIEEGKIVRREDGKYEVFSQEATGKTGQVASAGDYFKIDSSGCPYPNEKSAFERGHRHLGGDWYEQISSPVQIWTAEDPQCAEIRFLLSSGRLRIDPDDPARYFRAALWGTEETAARDAVVVFYEIERDGSGSLQSVVFNFVERSEFEKTYVLLPA